MTCSAEIRNRSFKTPVAAILIDAAGYRLASWLEFGWKRWIQGLESQGFLEIGI